MATSGELQDSCAMDDIFNTEQKTINGDCSNSELSYVDELFSITDFDCFGHTENIDYLDKDSIIYYNQQILVDHDNIINTNIIDTNTNTHTTNNNIAARESINDIIDVDDESGGDEDDDHNLTANTEICREFDPINVDTQQTKHNMQVLQQQQQQQQKRHNVKKKTKVEWTPELHQRFVKVVEQLGVDKAIPSKILQIMGVKGLTRHNIASHLQKYRWHLKQLQLTSSMNNNLHEDRGTHRRNRRHVVVMPKYMPGQLPMQYVWGHPTMVGFNWQFVYPPHQVHTWGNPQSYSPQRIPLQPIRNNRYVTQGFLSNYNNINNMMSTIRRKPLESPSSSPTIIVAAINEVLKNPCVPPPLGLKPPSLDSIISELHNQGVMSTTLISSTTS